MDAAYTRRPLPPMQEPVHLLVCQLQQQVLRRPQDHRHRPQVRRTQPHIPAHRDAQNLHHQQRRPDHLRRQHCIGIPCIDRRHRAQRRHVPHRHELQLLCELQSARQPLTTQRQRRRDIDWHMPHRVLHHLRHLHEVRQCPPRLHIRRTHRLRAVLRRDLVLHQVLQRRRHIQRIARNGRRHIPFRHHVQQLRHLDEPLAVVRHDLIGLDVVHILCIRQHAQTHPSIHRVRRLRLLTKRIAIASALRLQKLQRRLPLDEHTVPGCPQPTRRQTLPQLIIQHRDADFRQYPQHRLFDTLQLIQAHQRLTPQYQRTSAQSRPLPLLKLHAMHNPLLTSSFPSPQGDSSRLPIPAPRL